MKYTVLNAVKYISFSNTKLARFYEQSHKWRNCSACRAQFTLLMKTAGIIYILYTSLVHTSVFICTTDKTSRRSKSLTMEA